MPEIVSCDCMSMGALPTRIEPARQADAVRRQQAHARRPVYFDATGFVDCAVYRRSELPCNVRINGPIIVEERSSTTVVSPADTMLVDDFGNLVITVGDYS